uniref:Secreted protein n=1 Tax=Anguilla anguilla TaxID=7936 RepID=A0A0E9SLG9_ANGAN
MFLLHLNSFIPFILRYLFCASRSLPFRSRPCRVLSRCFRSSFTNLICSINSSLFVRKTEAVGLHVAMI